MQLILTRDSVAAGDDFDAPHRRIIKVADGLALPAAAPRRPWVPDLPRCPYLPEGARVWWSTGAHRSRRPNSVREVPACIGPCVSARSGRHSAFRGRPAVGGGAASRPKMTRSGSRQPFCALLQQRIQSNG
jgi:hypothetical protein